MCAAHACHVTRTLHCVQHAREAGSESSPIPVDRDRRRGRSEQKAQRTPYPQRSLARLAPNVERGSGCGRRYAWP
eukprot:scaffold102697_cov69-Phaeocystis_antarctica.AAC.4